MRSKDLHERELPAVDITKSALEAQLARLEPPPVNVTGI